MPQQNLPFDKLTGNLAHLAPSQGLGVSLHAEFLHNPPEAGFYCHCPSLLRITRGDLLAIWYAYPEEEVRDASLIVARLPRGESQWESGRRLFPYSTLSSGNPLLFEHPPGTIRLLFVQLQGRYWTDAELYHTLSTDGGATWARALPVPAERGSMVRHAPLLLRDGSLLLPTYHEGSRQSALWKSIAPFEEWREVYRFRAPNLIQPALVRQEPDQLIAFFRPFSDLRRIWRSHSFDEGGTWSPPLPTPLPSPLSGIAAFALGRRIAVVYNHTEEHQRYPLSLAFSSDRGVSWNEPWHLESAPIEISYPSFLADEEGVVHGLYTYNRRMIKYVCYRPDQEVEPA